MGSTLASREDGVINALLEVFRILEILPEEDETSTRTAKSFMTVKNYVKCTAAFQDVSEQKKTYVVVVTTSQYSKGLLSS